MANGEQDELVGRSEQRVVATVIKLVQGLGPDRVPDALALIAVLHPREKLHRAVMLYAAMAAGMVMMLGSTVVCLRGDPGWAGLMPLGFGSGFVGTVIAAVNGKPASIGEMGSLATKLSQALTQPGAHSRSRPRSARSRSPLSASHASEFAATAPLELRVTIQGDSLSACSTS